MTILFPNLASIPNQGIRELLNDTEEYIVELDVERFKVLIPNQPAFYISRESWQKLSLGEHTYRELGGDVDKVWLHHGYEVYAFAFCVAIDQNFKTECDLLKENKSKYSYFRIRTILRKITLEIPTSPEIDVFVETENIAYVDLTTAFSNIENGKREDCLKFINYDLGNPASVRQKNKVDNEVIVKEDEGKPSEVNKLPKTFLDEPNHQTTIVKNEGLIFGKERIISLLDRYEDKGTLIAFSLKPNNFIRFQAKINVKVEIDGVTGYQCPPYPICHV